MKDKTQIIMAIVGATITIIVAVITTALLLGGWLNTDIRENRALLIQHIAGHSHAPSAVQPAADDAAQIAKAEE